VNAVRRRRGAADCRPFGFEKLGSADLPLREYFAKKQL
jgi:hypothetical protein